MSSFKLFHLYNRLVRRGMTDPLKCDLCENELVTRLQKDGDEPLLQCLPCGIMIHPGLRILDKVQAVVSEFYPNSEL